MNLSSYSNEAYQKYMVKEVGSLSADEMMVSNMLRVLENPVLLKLMSEDEIALLCQTIKTHVVSRANFIMDIQKETERSHSK